LKRYKKFQETHYIICSNFSCGNNIRILMEHSTSFTTTFCVAATCMNPFSWIKIIDCNILHMQLQLQ
jgi:hypothetical protein